MREKLRRAWQLLRAAYGEWQHDNAMMLSAAVAFYATFSLAPLLLLLLTTSRWFFGEGAARQRLVELIAETAGVRASRAVDRVIEAASSGDESITIWSSILLVVAASAVFRQLKLALNLVLDVPNREDGGVLIFLRRRAFAVLIVIAGILLLLVALFATATVEWIRANAPAALGEYGAIWRVAEILLKFAVVYVAFGATLKFVPDVRMRWRVVAMSSAVAAVLFIIGQTVLGLYVARSGFASAYGAAASVILLLLYVYFTVAILLAAAELTEVSARDDAEFRRERRQRQDEERYQPRK